MATGTLIVGDAPITQVANRMAIDASLRNGGECVIGPGRFYVDRMPTLTSYCRLAGDRRGTTLVGPNFESFAPGISYTNWSDITVPVVVGDYCYLFEKDAHNRTLARITSADPWATDPPHADKQISVQRYARAMAFSGRGQTLTLVAAAPWVVAGMLVYVTDGPSITNASRGEYRVVQAVAGNTLTLDLPLKQDYDRGVIADVRPVVGARIEQLTLESPAGSNNAFKGHHSLILNGVGLPPGCWLTACSNVGVTGCSGSLQLNGSTDVGIANCRLSWLSGEEASFDVLVTDSVIGPNTIPTALRWDAASEARGLRLVRCEVYGDCQGGTGDDCAFEAVTFRGPTMSYVGGARLLVRDMRLVDGAGFTVTTPGATVENSPGVVPHA